MNTEEQVAVFLDLVLGGCFAELDDRVQALASSGISEEDAECLIAFVPIAFAQTLFMPLGVRFQKSYIIRDPLSNVSATGSFEHEPIFQAALRAADRLQQGEANERSIVRAIAALSAEFSAIKQLAADPSDLANIVLVEPLMMRIPLTHLTRKGWH